MKWCIEDDKGKLFEVTGLYDQKGEDTDELWKAEACCIKIFEYAWQSYLIEDRTVHRLQ